MVKGFFYSNAPKRERAAARREPGAPRQRAVPKDRPVGCDYCALKDGCRSPKMEPTGEGRRGILVVAEAPGRSEDEQGVQLIGEAGQVLRAAMRDCGFDLDRDCRKTNAVCCRPPDNRTPKDREVADCRPRLFREIERFRPRLILVLGGAGAKAVLGHRWKKDFPGISALRGRPVPDRDLGCWVYYTLHPSFVMRSQNNPNVEATFRRDLREALALPDVPFPEWRDEREQVQLVKDRGDIRWWLREIKEHLLEPVAMDYEASGLKLQRKGHFIRTCGLAFWDHDGAKAIAFPVEGVEAELKAFLQDPYVRKIMHHAPYEEGCSRAYLGTGITGNFLDTALGSHFLDSRAGISGLKVRTYLDFGVADYSHHMERYLEAGGDGEDDDKDGNAMNRVAEAPLDDLLLYNGLDAIYTLKLGDRLFREIKFRRGYGYDLLHQGMRAFCDMEEWGMRVDVDYCRREEVHLTAEIERLTAELMDDPQVRAWRERAGDKFKLTSNKQLADTLHDQMGMEVTKRTKKGNPSVSRDVLDAAAKNAPMAEKLVRIRNLQKARDTYLRGWIREAVDGVMHPNFSLVSTVTYRSSCSRPNLQNVPVRDKEQQKLLRTAIVPSRGRQILEADFKKVEVVVAACQTGDRLLLENCRDASKDMHRDTAMDLFFLRADQVTKEIRHLGKNGMVFPEFYGDYFGQIAPAIFEAILKRGLLLADGTPLIEHMRRNGIGTVEKFTEHVEDVERDFWENRFVGYREWKRKNEADYLRKGYMDTLTGFRISGPLDRKQINNYPIQGSAFHCNLWALTQVNRLIKQEKLESRLCSQIHDSMLIDLVPGEREHLVAAIRGIVERNLPAHWDWIVVPMGVDMEITPVDRPWYEKKPMED